MKRLFVYLSLIACSPAFSMSGNDLFKYVASDRPGNVTFATGYIWAVLDVVMEEKDVCVPSGVEANQARDIVKKYLTDKVATRHLPAISLTRMALREAFTCIRR
jgi:Rap1a immunity proteins